METRDRQNIKSATPANILRRVFAAGIVFLVTATWAVPLHAQFSGSGSGTTNDPYVITNVEQLQAITNNLSAHYVLGNDIDAKDAEEWDGFKGFNPIGQSLSTHLQFQGSLDGGGHIVSNLVIKRATEDYVGLFGVIHSQGSVKNLGLENVDIVGGHTVGGLAGQNAGEISESYTTGEVHGDNINVGGLIGNNIGTISESYSEVTTTGAASFVGGLAGCNSGSILECHATGNVASDSSRAGGLVGANSGTIARCYATGDVQASTYAGGFAGVNTSSISRSYAHGTVTRSTGGDERIGGFCGVNDQGTIVECYSTGAVVYEDAADPVDKGFVGEITPTVNMLRNYWDTDTSGQTTTAGDATGMPTADMHQQASFTNWNFADIWTIDEGSGYPFFIRDLEYTLEYIDGANGTITGESPQTVKHGKSGSPVTAVPNENYNFLEWDDDSTQNPRTDTNVTNSIVVTASFIRYWTVVYDTDGNGTISGVSTQFVNEGSDSTEVTAVPDTGYHFVQWDDATTNNPRIDTNITESVTNTAEFAINQYTLLYTAATNGYISGVTSQTVAHGSSGSTVEAMPDTGYRFVQWSDDSTENPRTDAGVTNDMSVEASFTINEYTLIYTAGPNGSIEGDSPQTLQHGDNGTEVTAVPDTGYRFVQWSDNSTENPRQDLNVSGDINVEAEFIRIFTLTYIAGPEGSISGVLTQVVDYGSSGSQVTAIPFNNSYFSQWSDGSTNNPRQDTDITEDITVTAEFTIREYTLRYRAGEHGFIDGEAIQIVQHGHSGTRVAARPAQHYAFEIWSDGSTLPSRQHINVTTNHDITASFIPLLRVRIFQPTSFFYSTTNSSVDLSGTVISTHPITNMTWHSDREGSGSVIMLTTNTWRVLNVGLFDGDNNLTVTAYDTTTEASASIRVRRIPPHTAPLIYIEQPSGHGTYSTSNTVVDLSGTLYDPNNLITNVSWTNSMGGSDTASWDSQAGTWSASGVSLSAGQNTIKVTAHNSIGKVNDTIIITCTPPDDPVWHRTFNDFNGDGISDLAVYHPESGNWYIRTFKGDIIAMANNWGRPGPVGGYRRYGDNMTYLTPADYTGDGITEIAVFNKFSDSWYVKETITGRVVAWALEWGAAGAIPVPGDYDGNGKTDFAVFEPATGLWRIWTWQGARFTIPFGWKDVIPVPGDYDGDGITDFAVYHPESGNWYIWTWQGAYYITQFGWSEAEPVPADYNGDGKTDLAVYHQASGTWHILTSDGYQNMQFGWSETVPVPGDYNGDGRTDLAVYHQETGTWYIWKWGGELKTIQWGWSETVPVRAGW